MSDSKLSLSAECKSVADGIRHVRSQLCQLLASGAWPEGAMPDITRVCVDGLLVAEALDNLTSNEPRPRTPSPYDPDVRM